MKKTYQSPLDFVQDYSEMQDWSHVLSKKSGGQYSDIFKSNSDYNASAGDYNSESTNFPKEDLRSWEISYNEFGSFIWYSILGSQTVKQILERLHLSLVDDQYILQIVPSNVNNKVSYSALIFHKNFANTSPQTITLNNVSKNRIIKDLYMNSINSFSNSIIENSMNWRKEHLFNEKGKILFNYMDISTFEQILSQLKFEILIYKYPELTFLSQHPTQGLGVANNKQPIVHTSSAGVIAKNPSGKLGVTTCYHEFMNDSQFDIGTSVYINNHKATVSSIHELSDSCFMTFDDQSVKINGTLNKGPLINVSPQQNLSYNFLGINGKKSTIVTGWDPTIPFVRPNVNIINMQKVMSTADTQRGDSGAALIDNNDFVVGFAGFRTGVGFKVPFSMWIWAEEVYYAHKIK